MISEIWLGRIKLLLAAALVLVLVGYHLRRLEEVRDEVRTADALEIATARAKAAEAGNAQRDALALAATTRLDALADRLLGADKRTTTALKEYHDYLLAHPDSGAALRGDAVVRLNAARDSVYTVAASHR